METIGFSLCCGAQILKNFPYGDDYNPITGNYDYDRKKGVGEWLREKKKLYQRKAILVLTLNGIQHTYLKTTMARNGFKVMGSGYNRNHSSTVYLYAHFNQRVAGPDGPYPPVARQFGN